MLLPPVVGNPRIIAVVNETVLAESDEKTTREPLVVWSFTSDVNEKVGAPDRGAGSRSVKVRGSYPSQPLPTAGIGSLRSDHDQ